jgi:Gdp/GTP exchange factor required for growth at low temperatures
MLIFQKSYHLNNYNSLVAIIAGLRTLWTNQALRRCWSRVGIWEMRMFTDLIEYTTNSDDFKLD